MRSGALCALGAILLAGPAAPALGAAGVQVPTAVPSRVRALRITILSTMLADAGIGEWGFAALVEADGHRILFDTGSRPDTVLTNARELALDLTGVPDVVLSHNHDDHTGGLMALRRALSERDPAALSVAHVGRGIFWERPNQRGPGMAAVRQEYEATGGRVVVHDGPAELYPGVWLTGPVPRVHPERNWSMAPGSRVRSPDGLVEDDIPESLALVVDTDSGLVVVSGCGHAGIVNTLERARQVVRMAPIHAALGGFHLFRATDAHLAWTAERLRGVGLQNLVGAHCTGIEAVFRLREEVGLSRETAVVGAVGASFTLGEGIDPLALAR